MSKIKKSLKHKVVLDFSGKSHFFTVGTFKNNYEVSVQAGCTCRYMAVQGTANKKVCSHIMAACNKIGEGIIDTKKEE